MKCYRCNKTCDMPAPMITLAKVVSTANLGQKQVAPLGLCVPWCSECNAEWISYVVTTNFQSVIPTCEDFVAFTKRQEPGVENKGNVILFHGDRNPKGAA